MYRQRLGRCRAGLKGQQVGQRSSYCLDAAISSFGGGAGDIDGAGRVADAGRRAAPHDEVFGTGNAIRRHAAAHVALRGYCHLPCWRRRGTIDSGVLIFTTSRPGRDFSK